MDIGIIFTVFQKKMAGNSNCDPRSLLSVRGDERTMHINGAKIAVAGKDINLFYYIIKRSTGLTDHWCCPLHHTYIVQIVCLISLQGERVVSHFLHTDGQKLKADNSCSSSNRECVHYLAIWHLYVISYAILSPC